MVAATRWRQDSHLAPSNPWQTLRWYPAYPGDGGFATFGWSPQPLEPAVRPNGHSIMPYGGLTGAFGAPGIPTMSTVMKVIGAVGGVIAGAWLAKRNIER
jgi:hypothetical protein